MNRNSIFLVTLSLVIGLVGLSLNAYAQTSDIIQLDDRNHYGQLSIDNIHVSEKEYYKVISMDVHVKVKDLALEDTSEVFWGSITLINENGKKYQAMGNVGSDCNPKQQDGTFYELQTVSGSEGGIGQHSLCYMVEKEFNNFKVYYVIPYYNIHNPDNPYSSFQIGSINLNQNQNPITSADSYAKNIVTNASSYARNLVNNATSYVKNVPTTQPSDFFSQIIEWLKNLFKFS